MSETLIFETDHFWLEAHPKPFLSREEGGHLRIMQKQPVTDRTKLSAKQAIELMRFTMVAGEALQIAMNKQGIPVVKINYEDLGNWAFKRGEDPKLHVHIFGRAKNAVKQKFPEAVYLPDRSTGFYDDFVALTVDEREAIRLEVEELFSQEKYSDGLWGL